MIGDMARIEGYESEIRKRAPNKIWDRDDDDVDVVINTSVKYINEKRRSLDTDAKKAWKEYERVCIQTKICHTLIILNACLANEDKYVTDQIIHNPVGEERSYLHINISGAST